MLKGLYTAYSGMMNEQHRMDVLTNNLANSATSGFKKEGTTSQAFSDVLAYKIKDASESPNIARKVGVNTPGVKIGENYTNYDQGSLRNTGNTFDLALSGEGFFAVEFTNKEGEVSTMYTRDGAFTMNKDGYIVNKNGDFLLGKKGQIKVHPEQDVVIDEQGRVMQNGTVVDSIDVVDFEDYNYLEHYGETYFKAVEDADPKVGEAKVLSGFMEMSNVQVVSEMVELISVTRAYEANQKIIQAYDSTLEISVSQVGKL